MKDPGKRTNSEIFGGAAWPSLYSALRSGKLTPTQMIFSGAAIGISQVKSPFAWVAALPRAAAVKRGRPPAAITSPRDRHAGKSGDRAIIPSAVTAP